MQLIATREDVFLLEDENLVFTKNQDGVGDFLSIEEAQAARLVVWLPARFCRVAFAPGCTQLTWVNEWYQADFLPYPAGSTREWFIDYEGRRKFVSVYGYHGLPGGENDVSLSWQQISAMDLTHKDFERFFGVPTARALVVRDSQERSCS